MPDDSYVSHGPPTPGASSDELRRRAISAARLTLTDTVAALAALDVDTLTVDGWQAAMATHYAALQTARAALNTVSDSFGLTSGQARILSYMQAHLGEVVTGTALAGVAGIGEWARRVRELRVENGWPIHSGMTRADLRPDEYVLMRPEPDLQLAERCRVAKDTRAMAGSGQTRALTYLQRIYPHAADQEQMAYVSKIASWTRRVRELEELGWDIRSNVDEPDLLPGSYRLGSLTPGAPRPRHAVKLRYEILERDDHTCQDCGAQPTRDGVRLQVHHILPVHRGGTNDRRNLITLCEDDHAGRHALMRGQTTFDELREPGRNRN